MDALNLSTADVVLLAIASFVAVTTLVRLMQAQRDALLKKLGSDFEAEQNRLKAEELQRKTQQAKEKGNDKEKETAA